MTTISRSAKLADLIMLNPRLVKALGAEDLVSFVPMTAVDAETASISTTEVRRYVDVSKGYTTFEDGDILVAKITPCFENGKIAQVKIAHSPGFGSTEFHVLRPRDGELDSRYLLHYLRQNRVRRDGERKMIGSAGQRRVPPHFFESLYLSLPSMEEQQRIAAALDQVEELRGKRREALAQLGELNQSIFLEMFGHPVSNPRGLPLVRFGDVGRLDRGVSKYRPRNAPDLLGGPYPLVQTGEVANCDGYIRGYVNSYSEFGLQQSRMWPAGTLCITIAANIAKTGILTFDACFPDSVVGFTSEDPGSVEYVRSWLSFLQSHLERSAPMSAQRNINLAILRNLGMPLPSIEQRQEFALRVEGVERMKVSHRAHLAELDALFASLQYRAFRGEL